MEIRRLQLIEKVLKKRHDSIEFLKIIIHSSLNKRKDGFTFFLKQESDPIVFEKSHSSTKKPFSNGFKVGLNTWFALYKNLLLWPDSDEEDSNYQVGCNYDLYLLLFEGLLFLFNFPFFFIFLCRARMTRTRLCLALASD